MAAWNADGHHESSVAKLVDSLQNAMDTGHSGEQRQWAKLAISNQEDGDAWGVMIMAMDPPDPPSTPSGTCQFQTFTTDHHYQSKLFDPAAAYLTVLSDESAFYANVTMTNQADGTSTFTVFYIADSPVAPPPPPP